MLTAAAQELLAALTAADDGCSNGGLGPGYQNGHGEEVGTRIAAARAALQAKLQAIVESATPGEGGLTRSLRAVAADALAAHPAEEAWQLIGASSPEEYAEFRCWAANGKPPIKPQPKGTEPVAWLIDWPDEPDLGHYFAESPTESGRCRPLYTHPSPSPAPEHVPASIRERWNIERDGTALLVCFNDHEKGEGCRYERFVPESTQAPAVGAQFDAEGFRAWVLANLPDETVIGSSAWWADHLSAWAARFVKAPAA